MATESRISNITTCWKLCDRGLFAIRIASGVCLRSHTGELVYLGIAIIDFGDSDYQWGITLLTYEFLFRLNINSHLTFICLNTRSHLPSNFWERVICRGGLRSRYDMKLNMITHFFMFGKICMTGVRCTDHIVVPYGCLFRDATGYDFFQKT